MSFVVINLLHWHYGHFPSPPLSHSCFVCTRSKRRIVTLARFSFLYHQGTMALADMCIAITRFRQNEHAPNRMSERINFFHFVSFFLVSLLTKLTSQNAQFVYKTMHLSQYDYPIHFVGTKTTIIHPITSSSSFLSLWA